jgi:hypothetical protein
MRKILITAVLISQAVFSLAQRDIAIKIYHNTDIFKTEYNERETREVRTVHNFNVSRISLALDIKGNKGFTHELEVFMPEKSKSPKNILFPFNYEFSVGKNFDTHLSTYSMRYQISKKLNSNDNKLSFRLGAGINPYFVHLENEPKVSNTSYSSRKIAGFAVNISPGIAYKICRRFSLELNIPLKIYDFRGERIRIDNPAIPIWHQRTSEISHLFFEGAYTVRFGVRYNLKA